MDWGECNGYPDAPETLAGVTLGGRLLNLEVLTHCSRLHLHLGAVLYCGADDDPNPISEKRHRRW
jgi:hypothetical protein